MPRKRKALKEVTHLAHEETRRNIPTEELRDFVAEAERNPPPIRYPRDQHRSRPWTYHPNKV